MSQDIETQDDGPTIRGATHNHEGQSLASMWDKFRDTGDDEARNSLAEFYFDMVRANSENISRIVLEAIEENDFYQAGVVAFYEALAEFNPAEHGTFEEFGSLAIRRAIVEEIRMIVGAERET